MLKRTLWACLFFALPAFGALAQDPNPATQATTTVQTPKAAYVCDTLYFGTEKQHGGMVTSTDWKVFLSKTVTPLFPDGLTWWKAHGQWKEGGNIEQEDSYVLQLLHPSDPKADAAIQKLVSIYKAQFDQQSVMWVRSAAQAAF